MTGLMVSRPGNLSEAASIRLELAVIVVYVLTGATAQFAGLPSQFVSVVANVVFSVLATGLLSRLGWWRTAGFRYTVRPRDLLWFLPLLLPVGFSLAAGIEFKGLALTSTLLISALLIGFTEEAIFRWLILAALKGKGIWTAAIVSSVLFGVSHALNGVALELEQNFPLRREQRSAS